jgi:hypothetical protein
MTDLINYLQLGTNGFALMVAGWIYFAYLKNLRSILKFKDEQIKVVEKNLSFWKDKALDFEKKTPEYIEDVLSKRIKHREEEIKRLDEDKENNFKILSSKTKEIKILREQLEKAKYIGRALTYYDLDSDQEIIIPESDIEIEQLGQIAVDSASILITDPSYASSSWRHDIEYEDIRLYKDVITNKVYQYKVDFDDYREILAGFTESVAELINEKKLVSLEVEREYTYSLPGSMYAAASKKGFGVLNFENGIEGAGICVKTVYGDGMYPVYGERYNGELYRIYIELQ